MDIITPSTIESVAWEGALDVPETTRSYSESGLRRPVVTLGKPEIWPAAKALENEVGKKWVPPLGGSQFWLVRLACTLHEPPGGPTITEAVQALYLRPQNHAAGDKAVYSFSLYPDRLSVENQAEFNIGLGPELKFTGVEAKAGEIGAKITYRKVFPIIQGYGAGEPAPFWIFKPHAAYPLDGSQFVYAVVAAQSGSGGAHAHVELTVTVESRFGPVRFGLPEEAKKHVAFIIP